MARGVLRVDGVVIKEFAITKERTTIGRKAHNDIQVEDPFLSGEHAVITLVDNEYVLEDLDSSNGTKVNGKPVKRQALKSADLIGFGDYTLGFIEDAEHGAENFLFTRMTRNKAVKSAT